MNAGVLVLITIVAVFIKPSLVEPVLALGGLALLFGFVHHLMQSLFGGSK